jgi:predicted GNAT superfamily acetyltransferase
MRWTFDPLLSSNAHFNFERLGATVLSFHPNCYGSRTDTFNTDDTTDRIRVSWRLDRPIGRATVAPNPKGPSLIATTPLVLRSSDPPVEGAHIPIPGDYQRLRADDRATADAWRVAVGRALTDVYAAGLGISGVGAFGYGVSGPLLESDTL